MIIDVTEPSVFATIGLPGSGKTTWADEQVRSDDTGNLTVVNRDHIRAMLRRPVSADEKLVTDVQYASIQACLKAGKSVIVDDTNLNPEHLASLSAFSHTQVKNFTVCAWFLHVPPSECVTNDLKRPEEHQVGSHVIYDLYARWREVWPQMNGHPREAPELRLGGEPCAG
jgi:predicted kinase